MQRRRYWLSSVGGGGLSVEWLQQSEQKGQYRALCNVATVNSIKR